MIHALYSSIYEYMHKHFNNISSEYPCQKAFALRFTNCNQFTFEYESCIARYWADTCAPMLTAASTESEGPNLWAHSPTPVG